MGIDYVFKEGQKIKIINYDNTLCFIKGIVIRTEKDHITCQLDGWDNTMKYFKKDYFQIQEDN